jgi:hypothetical protein
VNQTASPVVLVDVGLTVPASGQLTLTNSLFVVEILNSPSVQAALTAGDLAFTIDGTVYTSGQSSVLANPVTIYGSSAGAAASLGESQTTSGTFQNKVNHTTAALPVGTYLFWAKAEFGSTSSLGDVEFQAFVDSAATNMFQGDFYSNNADAETCAAGWIALSFGSATTHTVQIQYRRQGISGSARVRNAQIMYWRVL